MKDELREYKRERILEECSRLFYERGFANTTVDAIAERLHVTKPFIYKHFEGKHALLIEIYERATRRLVDLLEESLAADTAPDVQLREFVSRFARENIESQMISTIFLQEEKHLASDQLEQVRAREREFNRKLTDLVKRGVDAGIFDVDDPGLASLAISGMVRWIQRWYRPEGRLSPDMIRDTMGDFALSLVRYSGQKRKPQALASKVAPARKTRGRTVAGKGR